MKKDSIGNRMKENYENPYRIKLTRRTPVILRLDGKAFHTLTRGCEKPFDTEFYTTMYHTMLQLCKEIQGVRCGYMQSDEISLLLVDFDTIRTEAWFDYNLQKIVSVSAGIASAWFTKFYGKTGIFDSRAFNIPVDEVKNYFIWRQKDWMRNSIQMLSQSHYSHKELHGKNQADMHEMLHEKGVNWADLDPKWKNGTFLFKDDRDWKPLTTYRCIQYRKVENDRDWKPLTKLILTDDGRPVVGNLFEYLVWKRYEGFTTPIDVFNIER